VKLSVVIITYNEEKNIRRCLESLQWADEIVVVDSHSTDGTPDICREMGARIVDSDWLGFGRTKKMATARATHDWVLSIDADEAVTPVLQQQIEQLLAGKPEFPAYRIRRSSFYLGTQIRHSGWDRDCPVRLFNRNYGTFNEKEVHESVKIPGAKGTLPGPLLHYSYPTVASHLAKMNRYTDLGAAEAVEKGKTSSIFGARLRGTAKFINMFFLKRGFLDGAAGYLLARNSAFGVYLKYLKIWQKSHEYHPH
jgi:glycosyltransferase involved in cell wall biosynthesis